MIPFKLTPDTELLEIVYVGNKVWWEPELTNQSCWIVVLSNVIVRPPSPPPRGHPLCTVKTDQTEVHELARKALDEKTLALPCWLNGVRE